MADIPSFENWPGVYNFHVQCEPPTEKSPAYTWSSFLSKLFVEINKTAHVKISATGNTMKPLRVRATPVYSKIAHVQEPVVTCYTHSRRDLPFNSAFLNDPRHFVRSDMTGIGVNYEESSTGRLSLLFFLFPPHPEMNFTDFFFKLACHTSCLKRRPIRIIFTLELNNEVVGRQVMNLKVCANPLRDSRLEEMREKNKRQRSLENDVYIVKVKGKRTYNMISEILDAFTVAEYVKAYHPEIVREAEEELASMENRISNPETC